MVKRAARKALQHVLHGVRETGMPWLAAATGFQKPRFKAFLEPRGTARVKQTQRDEGRRHGGCESHSSKG